MADQDPGRSVDDRVVRWLLAHVDVPGPDAAFVNRLRELLVRGCPAT